MLNPARIFTACRSGAPDTSPPPKTGYRTESAKSPIDTTDIPITAPPGKATAMASLNPLVAAWVVRTLARVAMCIPTRPALNEQIAPMI